MHMPLSSTGCFEVCGIAGAILRRIDKGLLVELKTGYEAVISDGIMAVAKGDVAERFHFEVLPSSKMLSDMPDAVALSPILRLNPEKETFTEPVLLIVPVCEGATKVWRSREAGGWDEVADVKFMAGHAILHLDHFCDMFSGIEGTPSKTIKVIGLINDSSAKFAITHISCDHCLADLADFLADCDLKGYRQCTSEMSIVGKYKHLDTLNCRFVGSSGLDAEEVQLDFEHMPYISRITCKGISESFQLQIQDRKNRTMDYDFRYLASFQMTGVDDNITA